MSTQLNHGGSSPDNPILDGMALTLRLAKQNADETLRQVWVTVDGSVFGKLTPLATVGEFAITVPLIVGQHLSVGFPAVANVVHFTTSLHRHAQTTVYCADVPPVVITLDGYDGSDWERPVIYPLLDV